MVATLSDVAARAGVAASTVSYVISGKRPISPRTRERVLRAVAELGYHPHAGARALASHRSDVIALMMPLRGDMYMPVIMEIAMSVAANARRGGRDVLLLTGEEGSEGVRRVAASGLADAVILMDIELDDARLPVLRETSIPSVLIGRPDSSGGLTCVDLDFTAAGAVCADHLADLGHRQVALIGADPSVYRRRTGFAARTLAGFLDQCRRRGLEAVHHPCAGTFDATARVLARILEERPATSGFVVQNESAAALVPHLLRRYGKATPEDASVIAICPENLALQAVPHLTAVAIPAQELGRRAVGLAVAQIAGLPTTGTSLIDPCLVVRASTERSPARSRTAA